MLLFLVLLFLPSCREEEPPTATLTSQGMLPSALQESSGLLLWNGSLWTHNDSGNANSLYRLSPSDGSLQGEIQISNAENTDWEDLAQDDTYFYIGDFGNNDGNREDLRIYRILKEDLDEDEVNAEMISFRFPDQNDFSNRPKAHDFDCEAMIAYNGQLFLFSKNHLDKQCRLYQLPSTPGDYEATLLSTFATDGLVTGADIDPAQKTLYLLAYNQTDRYQPFIWVFTDFPNTDFWQGTATRINFTNYRKTEGLCFWENRKCYLTSESRSVGEETLYSFDAAEWLK